MGLGEPETSCELPFPQDQASAKLMLAKRISEYGSNTSLRVCVNQTKLPDHMQADASFLSFLDASLVRSQSQPSFLNIDVQGGNCTHLSDPQSKGSYSLALWNRSTDSTIGNGSKPTAGTLACLEELFTDKKDAVSKQRGCGWVNVAGQLHASRFRILSTE